MTSFQVTRDEVHVDDGSISGGEAVLGTSLFEVRLCFSEKVSHHYHVH